MKASLAIELIFYGLILTLVSPFIHWLAPEIPAHFRYAGFATGALVFICGAAGLVGYRRRFWALFIQSAVSILLAVELVLTWQRWLSPHPFGLLFLALMLMLSIQLIRLLARPEPEEPDPFEPRDIKERHD